MTEEIQAELDVARQSLREARTLASVGLPRGAAARAYFAMFHAATAMLLSEGKRFKSHKETIGAFGRCFTKKGRLDSKFHRYLIDAEDFREVADYTPCAPIAPEKVEQMIKQASEFLTMAEDFLRGGRRQE